MSEKEYCEKAWAQTTQGRIREKVILLHELDRAYAIAKSFKEACIVGTDIRHQHQCECDRLCGEMMRTEAKIIELLKEEYK